MLFSLYVKQCACFSFFFSKTLKQQAFKVSSLYLSILLVFSFYPFLFYFKLSLAVSYIPEALWN